MPSKQEFEREYETTSQEFKKTFGYLPTSRWWEIGEFHRTHDEARVKQMKSSLASGKIAPELPTKEQEETGNRMRAGVLLEG